MNEKELFEEVWKLMIGQSRQAAFNVGMNLVVNVLRQYADDRKTAEAIFDEAMSSARTMLLSVHYDPTTGKRRQVHMFTHMVQAPFHQNENDIYPPRL